MPQPITSDLGGDREKFLFYGEFGTGKTYAALTAPGPIYVMCVGPENELKTALGPSFTKQHGNKLSEIQYDVIEEPRGKRGMFTEATGYDRVCDTLDEALELRRKGDFPFQTLVIENATTLSEYAMHKVMVLGASGTGKESSKALKRLRDHNILIPADYDYKSEMSLMDQFIDWVYHLDVHVVLIAHEHVESTFDRTERTQHIVSLKPQFIGKNRINIPRLFDNVWRFSAAGGHKGRRYMAQTDGTDDPPVKAKTRVGGILPLMYSNVNLEDAIAKIQKASKEALQQEAVS